MSERPAIDKGFTPNHHRVTRDASNGDNGTSDAGNESAPLCPTHNKPMKPSKYGDGWYCPVKVADDDGTGKAVYCKQRVKA
jgi:hypothetical protein